MRWRAEKSQQNAYWTHIGPTFGPALAYARTTRYERQSARVCSLPHLGSTLWVPSNILRIEARVVYPTTIPALSDVHPNGH